LDLEDRETDNDFDNQGESANLIKFEMNIRLNGCSGYNLEPMFDQNILLDYFDPSWVVDNEQQNLLSIQAETTNQNFVGCNTVPDKQLQLTSDKQNAFNQRYNTSYEYQDKDINYLASYLLKRLQDVQFGIYHSNEGLGHTRLEDVVVNFPNFDKSIIGIYNPGGHWVVFAITNIQNTGHVFYKDSLQYGKENFAKFKSSVKTAYPAIKDQNIHCKFGSIIEQTSGLGCGIFALRNMQIIAEQLGANKDNFIEKFTCLDFCSLKEAKNLRKDAFAETYVISLYQHIKENNYIIESRKVITNNHEPELDELVSMLANDSSIIVKALKNNVEFKRTEEKDVIGIEISLPEKLNLDGGSYTYSYRVTWSDNLSKSKVQNILQKLKLEPSDFEVHDREIIIPAYKLFHVIAQINPIDLANIDCKIPEEVIIDELAQSLEVTSYNKNQIKNILDAGSNIIIGRSIEQEDQDNGEYVRFDYNILDDIEHIGGYYDPCDR
jgi:hypothetical protein